jgi:hypothetical protein
MKSSEGAKYQRLGGAGISQKSQTRYPLLSNDGRPEVEAIVDVLALSNFNQRREACIPQNRFGRRFSRDRSFRTAANKHCLKIGLHAMATTRSRILIVSTHLLFQQESKSEQMISEFAVISPRVDAKHADHFLQARYPGRTAH